LIACTSRARIQVAARVRVHQHFDGRHAAALARAHQALRNDGANRGGHVLEQRETRFGRVELMTGSMHARCWSHEACDDHVADIA